MLDLSNETVWKRILEEDSKLKELAIKAGVEDNPERAKELKAAFATNCGDGVVESEAERDLAQYLFCKDFGEMTHKIALEGRMLMARKARETEI